MRTLSIALVAAAIVLAALPADAARKALVIGNAAYKTQPLANPVNDAADMAGRLRELGFTVTHATDVTQRQMAAAVSEFRRSLTTGDEVVVFYAGHGMQVRGQNWLIPVDADPRDEAEVEVIAVSVDWLLRGVSDSGARTTLMLLDACRDNPFAKSFRSGSRGLARLEAAASGTLVSYAAKPGTVAADGTGRNSPYTAAWLAALSEPGLTHHQLLDRVHEGVRRATADRQETWQEGHLVGALVLHLAAPTVPSVGAPVPATDPALIELQFWQSAERMDAAAAYEAYLAQYPEGRFAALAKARLFAQKSARVLAPFVTPPALETLSGKLPLPLRDGQIDVDAIDPNTDYDHPALRALDRPISIELANRRIGAWAEIQKAQDALRNSDAPAFLRWLKIAAGKGHDEAQLSLGTMHEIGEMGVQQNFAEAARWYRLAAEQGHPHAQNALGFMFLVGNGVAQNLPEAVKWYRSAAEQGHPGAKKTLELLGHR